MVERLWREQFDFAYREYDTFIFPISIHPQVSGKAQVILMHERQASLIGCSRKGDTNCFDRFIEYINKHEGIEWVTMAEMAQAFKDGKIAGVTVEGGVDL